VPAVVALDADLSTVTTPEDDAAVLNSLRTTMETAAAQTTDPQFPADRSHRRHDLGRAQPGQHGRRNVEYHRALVDLTSAVLAMDPAAVAEQILAPRHRSVTTEPQVTPARGLTWG
jgi:hypothetical protein